MRSDFAPSLPCLNLPKPNPLLQCSIVVPAKNEEASLPALVAALATQITLDGTPLLREKYEIIFLLNNCTDRTAQIVAELQKALVEVKLYCAEITLAPDEAHVGRARQILFDVAAERFRDLDRSTGLILTTDADTVPAPDWIAQTEIEIARGVDGVGGRITLPAGELAKLPDGVRRYFLLDIGYRRALEELRTLYAPDRHDPFPRHHQHFGGSLAVTAAAYDRAGGMPLARSSEDVALYRALLASGGKFRHSYRVKTVTSARLDGRAFGGLADALNWWKQQCQIHGEVRVESAFAAEHRLARLGLLRQRCPEVPVPWEFLSTSDIPPSSQDEPIEKCLASLRYRNSILRQVPLAKRLAQAREFMEIVES
jgi:hypothetical protein